MLDQSAKGIILCKWTWNSAYCYTKQMFADVTGIEISNDASRVDT